MTTAEYLVLGTMVVLGASSWLHASIMASKEALQRAQNIEMNIREELPHDQLLFNRVMWVGGTWIALWMFLGAWLFLALKTPILIVFLISPPLACIAWSIFTMRHRYAFNAKIGFDWRYVDPDNNYDWRFIRHTLGWINQADYRKRVQKEHPSNYNNSSYPLYTKNIHNAGLLAYAFEVLVAAGAVAVAMWIA